MIEWTPHTLFILACLVLQWVLVLRAKVRHKAHLAELHEAGRELAECWRLLVQSQKVLDQYDDFNARHVSGLIGALARKYRAKDNHEAES